VKEDRGQGNHWPPRGNAGGFLVLALVLVLVLAAAWRKAKWRGGRGRPGGGGRGQTGCCCPLRVACCVMGYGVRGSAGFLVSFAPCLRNDPVRAKGTRNPVDMAIAMRPATAATCSGAASAAGCWSFFLVRAPHLLADGCLLLQLVLIRSAWPGWKCSVKKAVVNAGAFSIQATLSNFVSRHLQIRPAERVHSRHRLHVGYQHRQCHHRTALASLAALATSCG
jgi:hypothetical protein